MNTRKQTWPGKMRQECLPWDAYFIYDFFPMVVFSLFKQPLLVIRMTLTVLWNNGDYSKAIKFLKMLSVPVTFTSHPQNTDDKCQTGKAQHKWGDRQNRRRLCSRVHLGMSVNNSPPPHSARCWCSAASTQSTFSQSMQETPNFFKFWDTND